jgi:hypothetical protein
VLEGGEEGVLLGQGGALRLLQLLHRPHPTGEFLLEGDGGISTVAAINRAFEMFGIEPDEPPANF